MYGVSSFTALLEFATEKTAIIVGKPSKDFFMAALNDMNVDAEQAIMVGDDIGGLSHIQIGVLFTNSKKHT